MQLYILGSFDRSEVSRFSNLTLPNVKSTPHIKIYAFYVLYTQMHLDTLKIFSHSRTRTNLLLEAIECNNNIEQLATLESCFFSIYAGLTCVGSI